ncbi:unnamed protein product [Angiostrongylus costaricensis]|uniref:7TM_GPCR_Srx domain-containing protein n=1 Tax=Angiostrongylus costaricensis TaxID=334426 RepID=A0A0R3PRN0_ANGCS|nr:unnamed protein product [Angiostrongylus costaricensis]
MYSVACSISSELFMIFGYINNAWLIVYRPDSSEQFSSLVRRSPQERRSGWRLKRLFWRNGYTTRNNLHGVWLVCSFYLFPVTFCATRDLIKCHRLTHRSTSWTGARSVAGIEVGILLLYSSWFFGVPR